MKFKNVAVVMGGCSNEREVSLRSGAAIAKALRETGRGVSEVDLRDLCELRFDKGVQGVFLALHGGDGENGVVQGLLDAMGMPYTGSGAESSRLCMDKIASKRVFDAKGIPTPKWEVVFVSDDAVGSPCRRGGAQAPCGLRALPLVVKPPREGSSVGIARVDRAEDFAEAARKAGKFDEAGEVLVEAYIPGREWTVSVLGRRALPVVEIAARGDWYDYSAKYDPTSGTRYVFPEESDLTKHCQKIALEVFDALGCRGLGRVDFRITDAGEPFVLEMNTLPGFTATSLLPKAAAAAGMSFAEACAEVMELAAFDAGRD